ncbi:MAG: uroporphyrinogen-III synthase, partial [Xanthomonadales bacterium]|nr:uroporphyrinogen-III synthase [Xanthomonadales bacterium]
MSAGKGKFSHVLLTRPQAESEDLARMLAPMGIDAIIQPAQVFQGREPEAGQLEGLEAADGALLIFTSTRAVEFGLPRLPPGLLARARIAAIGPATAKALNSAGRRVDIQPENGFTSEALLETLSGQALSGPGAACVICAPGGRQALVEGLAAAGWDPRPVWVYERRAADLSPDALKAIHDADRLLSVFTSDHAMQVLSQRLPPSAWYAICRGEWLVVSERLQRLARAFGPAAV